MADGRRARIMSHEPPLHPSVRRSLLSREPFLWLNDSWRPLLSARRGRRFDWSDVCDAQARWERWASLLAKLFAELEPSGGIIESRLHRADALGSLIMEGRERCGRWFVKCDHALPIAGSIKARGGIYEVLLHAENLALRHGVIAPEDDRVVLASPAARHLFGGHGVAVGSTGNLGLSIGVMAAALGFRATVHMSTDAKDWKKQRLRDCGVSVVEHDGDFGDAVAAGRAEARQDPTAYFVDDESSEHLFFGYSVAAARLKEQLLAQQISVDARHPLFVYLPCGVGGAPGGITFGLRHLFADHVHCFLAEPVAAPCMLVRLACRQDRPINVREVGLDNRTEADGLAVGQASELAASLVKPLVSGVFTVADGDLFEDLYAIQSSEGLRIEPSAAAGLRGPRWMLGSEAGAQYLSRHDLHDRMSEATHVLWTTGGAFVPDEEYRRFHQRGRDRWRANTGRRIF